MTQETKPLVYLVSRRVVNMALSLFAIILILTIILMVFIWQNRVIMNQTNAEHDAQFRELNRHLEQIENRAMPCNAQEK